MPSSDLFAALAATWPAAETVRLGPWTLRRGEGGGNRVSAATLDGPTADPSGAEAAMRAWGQPPLFMIRPGDEPLDALLAARGYAVHDPSALHAAPAATLAWTAPDESAVFGEAPLACMAEMWAAGGIGPGRLAVMQRAPAPRVFVLGRLGDRPAGCAFAVVHGATAVLHALEVAPFARRQGLGARMTRALAAWSRDAGAATLAVAVTRANAPARALYAGLGMAEAASYHYRIAPAADGKSP
jgi:GNAT superfamily N-acetyltransferase